MKRIALVFAAAAAICTTAPAPATTIVNGYKVSGPADGTFTLGMDTNTSLFSLLALNLIIGGSPYDTFNAGLVQSGQDVTIGGNASGVSVLAPSGDDFKFTFRPADGAGFGGINSFFDVFFEIRPGDSTFATIKPMPEPATWATMLLGFAVIGFALRRQRTGALARTSSKDLKGKRARVSFGSKADVRCWWISRCTFRCPNHSLTLR